MAKISLLFLVSGVALSTPIQNTQNTINIAGLQNVHWPRGRPMPVKVTKTPSGQHIGWVKREAQVNGRIAEPPKVTNFTRVRGTPHPVPELAEPDVETGPEGTVPFQLITAEEAKKIPRKGGYPTGKSKVSSRSGNGHYYGNSNEGVTNYGGSCYLSLFQPAVSTSGSMSLIQIAVANQKQVQQTAESGWQVLPVLNGGDYRPHVFTYFTTNGYASEGDNTGGYNTLQAGFVQTSSTYYPGMTFSSISTVGGDQFEVPLQYQYQDGNWWVGVNNNFMGYYPGSVYAKGGSTSNTLGENADSVAFFGEVYDDPSVDPTTDMGSGQFASGGFGNSAYMHNLQVYSGTNGGGVSDYNGGTGESNAAWYTIAPTYGSGGSWGNYFYVGGPGSG